MKKLLIAWLLLFAIAFNLAGCATVPTEPTSSTVSQSTPLIDRENLDLLSAMIRQASKEKSPDQALSGSMANFSLSLLRNSYTAHENTLLSPYSVYLTLAMTANGAHGETLAQIEALLGMAVEELNPYALYLQNNGGTELTSANSLWFREDLSIEEPFLQSLKNYYEAQVYSLPFDSSTIETMNAWVREKTKDRISEILDQMAPNAQMYLINALTFDGSWDKIYTTNDLFEGTFHSFTGDQTVTMMTSTEGRYLSDNTATGFLKDYAGGRYSFMALLPNEGVSLENYLSALTGDNLLSMIQNAESTAVIATMPKIQLETTVELRDTLTAMGMTDAFTQEADLSGINGQQDLFVSRILHKTYLQVDEAGTQAGAVTVEEVVTKGISLQQKTVFLDRPFLMGIYDNANGCFLFLGTVENP